MNQLTPYSKHHPARSESGMEFKYIPKCIYQFWDVCMLDQGLYNAAITWVDLNPGWEVRFFTDHDARQFISDNFENDVLEAYDNIIPSAYRADLWRYCVLYINGGVYADMNKVLLKSLDDLLEFDTEFTSVLDRNFKSTIRNCIFNALICAKPRHPFLKKAIELITKNVQNGYYGINALAPTGPKLLGEAVNLVLERNQDTPFSVGNSLINEFKFTLWNCIANEIRSGSHKIPIVYKENDKITPCFRIRSDQLGKYGDVRLSEISVGESLAKDYGLSWECNRVYMHQRISSKTNSKHHIYISDEEIRKKIALKLMVDRYKSGNKKTAREIFFEAARIRLLSKKMIKKIFYYEIKKPLMSIFSYK